jgi:hypothetical protein
MSKNRILGIVSICVGVSLAAFAYLGLFTRYMADDFCAANVAQQYGVVGSVSYWYVTLAGQFTTWFLKSIMAVAGSGFVVGCLLLSS